MTEEINKRIPECGRYKLFQIPKLHDGVRQSQVACIQHSVSLIEPLIFSPGNYKEKKNLLLRPENVVCWCGPSVGLLQSGPSHWKMRCRCVAMLLEALFSDCERCDVRCFIKFPMNDICGEQTKRVRAMFSEKDTQLSTAMGLMGGR